MAENDGDRFAGYAQPLRSVLEFVAARGEVTVDQIHAELGDAAVFMAGVAAAQGALAITGGGGADYYRVTLPGQVQT